MILKNAVQPRMGTDGHGLKTVAIASSRLVSHSLSFHACLSVFIRGFCKFKCLIYDD